jgi:hypothetical protein
MTDIHAVEKALSGLRETYQADGYDLHVENVSSGVAKIRISAGPNACEECLVPKPIAINIIKTTLDGLPEIEEIELVYPTHK